MVHWAWLIAAFLVGASAGGTAMFIMIALGMAAKDEGERYDA